MARLPQVGGDKGNWGDILNDFLGQSLKPDGTLKPIDSSTVVGLADSLDAKADKTSLAPVATSGSYLDLTHKPTIPTSAADVGAATPADVDAKIATQTSTINQNFSNYQTTINNTVNGTISGAALSGRSLRFTTVGGNTTNVGNIVPNLTIGTVSQVSYATSPSASLGGTPTDPTLSLSIPQGTPGDLGTSTTGSWTGSVDLTSLTVPQTVIASLTGNVTITTLPTLSSSRTGTMSLVVTQDINGNRTITWPAGILWSEGTPGAPSLAVNAVTIFNLFWSGVQWYGFKAGQNFA